MRFVWKSCGYMVNESREWEYPGRKKRKTSKRIQRLILTCKHTAKKKSAYHDVNKNVMQHNIRHSIMPLHVSRFLYEHNKKNASCCQLTCTNTWSTRLPLALSVLGSGFLFFALKTNEKSAFLDFFGAPKREPFLELIWELIWRHFGTFLMPFWHPFRTLFCS